MEEACAQTRGEWDLVIRAGFSCRASGDSIECWCWRGLCPWSAVLSDPQRSEALALSRHRNPERICPGGIRSCSLNKHGDVLGWEEAAL